MPAPVPTRVRRIRRLGAVLGVVVVLVVLLLSHSFGRAVPTNNYRPLITTDAIESGCFPLPGDARFDGLSYQVRSDGDVETPAGDRRHLRGQYNLVERDEAQRLLVAAFTAVGFAATTPAVGSDPVVLRRGEEQVTIVVTELPDTSEETLVRGAFELDLPVAEPARPDDPICRSATSTKRWQDTTQVTR